MGKALEAWFMQIHNFKEQRKRDLSKVSPKESFWERIRTLYKFEENEAEKINL